MAPYYRHFYSPSCTDKLPNSLTYMCKLMKKFTELNQMPPSSLVWFEWLFHSIPREKKRFAWKTHFMSPVTFISGIRYAFLRQNYSITISMLSRSNWNIRMKTCLSQYYYNIAVNKTPEQTKDLRTSSKSGVSNVATTNFDKCKYTTPFYSMTNGLTKLDYSMPKI